MLYLFVFRELQGTNSEALKLWGYVCDSSGLTWNSSLGKPPWKGITGNSNWSFVCFFLPLNYVFTIKMNFLKFNWCCWRKKRYGNKKIQSLVLFGSFPQIPWIIAVGASPSFPTRKVQMIMNPDEKTLWNSCPQLPVNAGKSIFQPRRMENPSSFSGILIGKSSWIIQD